MVSFLTGMLQRLHCKLTQLSDDATTTTTTKTTNNNDNNIKLFNNKNNNKNKNNDILTTKITTTQQTQPQQATPTTTRYQGHTSDPSEAEAALCAELLADVVDIFSILLKDLSHFVKEALEVFDGGMDILGLNGGFWLFVGWGEDFVVRWKNYVVVGSGEVCGMV